MQLEKKLAAGILSSRAVFSSATSRKLHILDKHRSLTGWPRGMQSVSGNGSSGPRLSCLASEIEDVDKSYYRVIHFRWKGQTG